MGVTGLWRLIEPAGKPVPVETLENKVLAVDISIWLHQMVKGYQDAKGAPLPNAHLIGLFQRLCKLLYFRVKPIFVFDGGFPDLKKETIAKRQDNKTKYNSQSEKLKREIALLLGKKTAISSLLGKQISPKKNKPVDNSDDLFKLPALPNREEESDSSESEDEQSISGAGIDLHTVDLESEKIKNLPLKEKYDLLVELKETRKMNSWGKLHTLPKKSDNFSDFQLQRLLKRRKLQECLEETEKEIGDGCMSLNELESLLNEEGIDTKIESLPSRRIASNNTTRYLLISNVKQALAEAKQREIEATKKNYLTEPSTSSVIKEETINPETTSDNQDTVTHDELTDDLQKAIQMSLECMDESATSANTSKTDGSWTSFLTDSDYSDNEDSEGCEQPDMSSAKAYIMQYCDFTHKAINNIVKQTDKQKDLKLNKMPERFNNVKTIIEENIGEISSDERDLLEDKLICGNKEHANTKSDDKIIVEIEKLDEDFNDPSCSTTQSKIESSDINNSLASVLFVENANNEPILLETSSDDISESNNINPDKDTSSSSDNEFEEVPECDKTIKKPVIELTLNMGAKIEDDIFADIFDDKAQEDKTVSIISDVDTEVKKGDSVLWENNDKTSTKSINIKKDVQEENHVEKKEVVTNVAKDDTETKVNKETSEIDLENVSKPRKVLEKEAISSEKLSSMVNEIENEEQILIQEKGRLDRIGRNITDEMTKDAQELLRVFGIPYIVAPMEAEAQCAFLENIKLTDGTITDDSDIWLFGGKVVYKNFFNQKKHVQQYLSERIEKSFNLTREQLILLALLVGSDYTTGISGVGPVTALEILASFPFNKKKLLAEGSHKKETNKQELYQDIVAGLQEFKKWVRAGRRTDNVSLKKKLKNVSLTDDFPSARVVQAYLEPNVERSEDKFTWGQIDVTILRDYTKAKFGWSQNKLDEIIKPVLKRLSERKTQKTVHDFFKRKIESDMLDDQLSKRVKAAVTKMSHEPSTIVNDGDDKDIEGNKKLKRKVNKNKTADSKETSKAKKSKIASEVANINEVVKISTASANENKFEIAIPKTDRYQEFIPQREKDKQSLLENKMKAIELYRKTKIDKKRKTTKRKLPVPKEKAELSESSDSD